MKALVTGGTGFIGSHIVRALNAAGHEARVLHRSSSKLTALEGTHYESAIGDILDEASLRAACTGCDWVFHVAAVADYWRADQARMFEANVEATRRVLRAAREAGVQRVVFTSSAAAVGPRSDGRPADENDLFSLPPKQFPYGYSKALAERVVQDAVRDGQDVVIVNPVVVMGPGDLNMISGAFVTQIRQMGALVPLTSGGVAVVDVRDVAAWHIAAAQHGQRGERYLMGTANYPYRQWMAMIADTVGVRRPFFMVPDFVLPLVALGNDLARRLNIQTPIDADQIRLSSRNIYFDFGKTWAELGTPLYDMMTSLHDTYHWYSAHGYL